MIETFSLRYILNMFRVCLNSSKNGKAKRQSVYKITFGETTGIKRIPKLFVQGLLGGKATQIFRQYIGCAVVNTPVDMEHAVN